MGGAGQNVVRAGRDCCFHAGGIESAEQALALGLVVGCELGVEAGRELLEARGRPVLEGRWGQVG